MQKKRVKIQTDKFVYEHFGFLSYIPAEYLNENNFQLEKTKIKVIHIGCNDILNLVYLYPAKLRSDGVITAFGVDGGVGSKINTQQNHNGQEVNQNGT